MTKGVAQEDLIRQPPRAGVDARMFRNGHGRGRTGKTAHLLEYARGLAGRYEQRERMQSARRPAIDHRIRLRIRVPAVRPPRPPRCPTVKDPQLGLNGVGFHVFPAIKVNTTPSNDVFAFSVPLKMMLHPNATFYFQPAAGIAVSGYPVNGN
jgi:hypothetical protein